MSLFFLFALLILVFWVLRPALKLWRTYSKLKKGDFSVFGDFFGQPGSQKQSSAYDSDGQRKAGWTKAKIKKKKIPDDVGEYVKFTEVTGNEQQPSNGADNDINRNSKTTTVEQQVTDVEWEDIK